MTLATQQTLEDIEVDHIRVHDAQTDRLLDRACDAIVLLTDRLPNDTLYQQLKPALDAGTLQSLRVIGDAAAPHLIAQAVYAGHLAAREFDEAPIEGTPFQIERVTVR